MQIDKAIEAILFYRAEPVEIGWLAELLQKTNEEVEVGLATLSQRLLESGVTLVKNDNQVELAVASEWSSLIEQLRKDEMKRDIGKAGAETLAIIMYRGPITRAEVDRIRGVNSSYILRMLETRGLIERSNRGQRGEFKTTVALFRYLGIEEKTQMPEYAKVMDALDNFENQQDENE